MTKKDMVKIRDKTYRFVGTDCCSTCKHCRFTNDGFAEFFVFVCDIGNWGHEADRDHICDLFAR